MTAEKRDPAMADGAAQLSLGPLSSYLGFSLRRTQLASFRHLDRSAGDLRLTPGQYSLLELLEANPGVSQKRVSAVFGVDTSTLSTVLESLAQRGLIVRERAPHDRRTYAISLTRDGSELLVRMRDKIEAQEAAMAEALRPGEREALLDMLRRVRERLAGTSGSGSGASAHRIR